MRYKTKYRIVLTCFDNTPGTLPYADNHEELFDSRDEAYTTASNMAHEECAYLNDEDGAFDSEEIEGVFEVDDCANNAFEVRWYEKRPEERLESDCAIDQVTHYNIYPVEFMPNSEHSCRYRGFDILANHAHSRYAIEQYDLRITMVHSLNRALKWVDDFCIKKENLKKNALLAHQKQPLDSVIQKANQTRDLQAAVSAWSKSCDDRDRP